MVVRLNQQLDFSEIEKQKCWQYGKMSEKKLASNRTHSAPPHSALCTRGTRHLKIHWSFEQFQEDTVPPSASHPVCQEDFKTEL